MEGYASEDEQVERIKKWWQENGKALIVGLALGLGGLIGYRYWQDYKIQQSEAASTTYEAFLNVVAGGNNTEAIHAGEALIHAYPNSIYANLTALLLARQAVETGDLAAAEQRLRTLLDTSKEGPLRDVARVRLARVLLAQDNADGAWSLVEALADGHEHDRFPELKGDILSAQGKTEEARVMYLAALAEARDVGVETNIIELKLASVNGAQH